MTETWPTISSSLNQELRAETKSTQGSLTSVRDASGQQILEKIDTCEIVLQY